MSKQPAAQKTSKEWTKLGFTESEYDAIRAFFDSLDIHGTGMHFACHIYHSRSGFSSGYEI